MHSAVLSNYAFVIAGAGFFGSVIAERIANDLGRRVLVLEKRDHIGGNCYSKDDPDTGIHYHVYGTHVFHTSNKQVWDYINRFTRFNSYVHQVLTRHNGAVYQMPINLETINSFYGVTLRPFEVEAFLRAEIEKEGLRAPANFEEKAISLVGRPLYEAFIRGYTKKQWQIDPTEIPEAVLRRLPFRTNYNESYYFSRWQGIPVDGYTKLFERMLSNPLIDVQLSTDFFDVKDSINSEALVVYSGPIDKYFAYKHGRLDWRTLRFEHESPSVADWQGTSVMNYADEDVPWTRIHEPRHLHPEREEQYPPDRTLTIKEFSMLDQGDNPYYPVSDAKNQGIILKYREEAARLTNVLISGRLGDYRYYDMHETIGHALDLYEDRVKAFVS
jgi:UDP-galactopyranose mutase